MLRSLPPEQREAFTYLCEEFKKYNYIGEDDFSKYDVKRGLRNANGTGVLAGLTSICNVVGYDESVKDSKIPVEGGLFYRGIEVQDIVKGMSERGHRFLFEEVAWLLLFGMLPDRNELERFCQLLEAFRALPEGFAEDMILKCPSPNVMNKMASSMLAMYIYDDLAEEPSLENALHQAITLIACMPTIMVYAYQSKRWSYDGKSMFFHKTKPGLSLSENILRTSRSDKRFTPEEADLLDLCLMLHADHGGGNNSTFTARVVTSTGTDIYSAIAAALGALKGPRHGGANIKVMHMIDDIIKRVDDIRDDDKIAEYIEKVIEKEANDKSGLVYGMGHAVYTLSDPRAVLLREKLEPIAESKNIADELLVAKAIERVAAPILEKRFSRPFCANVDLYSGIVYRSLRFPVELFTPLFAVARMPGWCAHRVEEMLFSNRIMRPAYKYLGVGRPYVPLEDRE